ncbi:hypothetical protein FB451DRAFT_1168633 [Mycena latifolia]|nr:hypothetical protein FB451DRAFT_1168633 [Mycena latifolia]
MASGAAPPRRSASPGTWNSQTVRLHAAHWAPEERAATGETPLAEVLGARGRGGAGVRERSHAVADGAALAAAHDSVVALGEGWDVDLSRWTFREEVGREALSSSTRNFTGCRRLAVVATRSWCPPRLLQTGVGPESGGGANDLKLNEESLRIERDLVLLFTDSLHPRIPSSAIVWLLAGREGFRQGFREQEIESHKDYYVSPTLRLRAGHLREVRFQRSILAGAWQALYRSLRTIVFSIDSIIMASVLKQRRAWDIAPIIVVI